MGGGDEMGGWRDGEMGGEKGEMGGWVVGRGGGEGGWRGRVERVCYELY